MEFKKGDKVYCTGKDYWRWAKGKTAVVNNISLHDGWMQVRFDDYSYGGHEHNGHSGPVDGFAPLTKLHKALK